MVSILGGGAPIGYLKDWHLCQVDNIHRKQGRREVASIGDSTSSL